MQKIITKKSPFLISLIILLAAVLRLIGLSNLPFRVGGDASRFALEGIKMWEGKQPLFATGWYGHTNLLFYSFGLFLKIFNNRLLANRLFSATGGILAIPATYLMTKKLFSQKVALYAAFFLSVSFFHLVISRAGTEVAWVSFFAPLAIYFFLQESLFSQFLSGITVGISQYVYPGARLIPILLLILMFLLWAYKKRNIQATLRYLCFLAFGFILIYGPMIHYYWLHPENYWARINIVGIFQSGWLEQQKHSAPIYKIFITQIKNSYSVFWIPVKPGAHFWVFKTPYLEKSTIILFSLGILLSLLSLKKNYQYLFILLYFLIGVFLAGVLTTDSPTASRYVIIFPVIAVFVGVGMEKISYFLKKSKKNHWQILILLIIFIMLSEGLTAYWDNETREAFKYDKNTQIATYAGRYLSQKQGNFTIFFVGNNYMYYKAIPTLEFLTKKKGMDVFGPVETVIPKLKRNTKSQPPGREFFIILPERKKEIPTLKKYFPNGQLSEFKNPFGELLFFLFEKSPPLGDQKP